MPEVNIADLAVQQDMVTISGTVDGEPMTAYAWLSHLYPKSVALSANATPEDIVANDARIARGCQNDDDRKKHLSDKLLDAAGFVIQEQEFAIKVTQALQVLISVPDKPPTVIDPTVAAVPIEVGSVTGDLGVKKG